MTIPHNKELIDPGSIVSLHSFPAVSASCPHVRTKEGAFAEAVWIRSHPKICQHVSWKSLQNIANHREKRMNRRPFFPSIFSNMFVFFSDLTLIIPHPKSIGPTPNPLFCFVSFIRASNSRVWGKELTISLLQAARCMDFRVGQPEFLDERTWFNTWILRHTHAP